MATIKSFTDLEQSRKLAEILPLESADIDNKFIKMRETKPKDISEFLDRLTAVEQEFLWEHIAKIRELDKEEQKPANWFQELEDKLANATPQQLAEWKEKYFKEEPAGWSEEDEENLNWFEKFFRAESVIAEGKNIPQDRYLWFKNLKGRVQPQNTWKPSDAQIASITCAVRKMKESACYDSELVSLFNNLKKLREE